MSVSWLSSLSGAIGEMKATAQESARAIKEMGRTKEIAASPGNSLPDAENAFRSINDTINRVV